MRLSANHPGEVDFLGQSRQRPPAVWLDLTAARIIVGGRFVVISRSAAEPTATRIQWPRIAWPVLLAATIFAASSQSELAGPPGIPYLDKMAHTAVFGLLATLVIRVFFSEKRRGWSVLVAIAIVSAYGIADEIRQSFTPGRLVEVADWAADTIGAILAAMAYSYWRQWRRLLEVGRRGRPTSIATIAVDGDAAPVTVSVQDDRHR